MWDSTYSALCPCNFTSLSQISLLSDVLIIKYVVDWFVGYLITFFFNYTSYIASDRRMIMNGELERMQKAHYSFICMEGLWKTIKNLSQKSWSLNWRLNLVPPKYKVGVLNHLTALFGNTELQVGNFNCFMMRLSCTILSIMNSSVVPSM
jgi:hypothetical protein